MKLGEDMKEGAMSLLSKSLSSWFSANPASGSADPELPSGILALTDDIFGTSHANQYFSYVR